MRKIKTLDSISRLNSIQQEAISSIPTSERYVIALSGGLDSIALAFFCIPFLKKHSSNILAVHINHGLSPNAKHWATFCQQFCLPLGIPCHVVNVNVTNQGEGLEAAARKARYEVFDRFMADGGVLLQGHHLNDQAETVLMRVLKGLGPQSFRGIPKQRPISKGVIFRPWLHLPRKLLQESAESFQLSWIEDESNKDLRFERNFIRNKVLPLLKQRQPTVLQDLANVAKKSQAMVDFIDEWCEQQKNIFLHPKYLMQLSLTGLRAYSSTQQVFILRYWFDLLGVAHPSEANFQRIFKDLLVVKTDTKAEVTWRGNVLRVFDDALFCFPEYLKSEDAFSVSLSLSSITEEGVAISLPHGELTVSLVDDKQLNFTESSIVHIKSTSSYKVFCFISKELEEIIIRPRKSRDKIYLHDKHSASLKKLYQSSKILPWHREKLPIISTKDTVVCSLAGFIAKGVLASYSQKNNTHLANLYCFHYELA